MSYNYQTERPTLFTEEGVKMLIAIRDEARRLLAEAGAFRAMEVMKVVSGDTWTMLATLDYLVERGDILCVTGKDCRGQDQVFIGVT